MAEIGTKIETRVAYGEALAELGAMNDKIVVMDADLSGSTKTALFKKAFPDRFFNTGIAEGNMAGVAAGLAAAGQTVIISSFAMFAAGRAFEQIRNSICYPRLNVKICATHAGITVGQDGGSHQCLEDLRFGRGAVPVIFDEKTYRFEIGKGVTLKEGNDVTLIGTGITVDLSLKAADILKNEGIDARVINIATVKPIDRAILLTASAETGAIVTSEEHNVIGGLGSAVCEVLSEEAPCVVERVGVNDSFGRSGAPADLLSFYHLTPEAIAEKAKTAMRKAGKKV